MRMSRWIVSLVILCSCARQAPPPGGPEDRTPPQIIKVTPEPNATRVPRTTHLEFIFSEKVEHASFEQSFFVSPALRVPPTESRKVGEQELHFRWHGRRVEVVFPDSLQPRRTYVVTVGTDVRDLRNNRLEQAYSLAFSTGDSVDTGEIHGRIFHDKPAGVLILAYLLETGFESPGRGGLRLQPNPARDFADYTTQVGMKGDFVLPYLSDGRYRLFALEDRNGDRLYNRGEEPIGVSTREVALTPSQRNIRDLNFRLAFEDTLQPRLTSVTAPDQIHLELRFDEKVAVKDSLWQRYLRIVSSTGDSLRILAAAPHPLDLQQIHVLTNPQQAATYKIFLEQMVDASGNPLDSLSRQIEFAGTTKPDTTRPRLVEIIPADSTRNVAVTATVEMIFSEMMANASILHGIQKQSESKSWPLAVQDSSGKSVSGKGIWLNPFQFRFQPDTLWQSRARYVVKIFADSTFDPSGNTLFDTTRQIIFWTLNADTLSALSGKITDAQPDATGTIYLTLRQPGAGMQFGATPQQSPRSAREYSVVLPAPGPYRFEYILPGLYQLSAFRDANQNGRYDFGSAFPFIPAERFVVWPDTMKVRSRWPNEGNDFVLP
ncbi:MAG: Ig-like domain-containing protein [candidate division KSB1 bacterium]|nr:Ig-like domain-containing protein [candidate division KSB1 bacterium]MDZ7303778.1 Ig-like domain-containing protein [candidate division KSB1 bacterium]